MKRLRKKGIAFPLELPPQWIIALIMLALTVAFIMLLIIKGEGAIEFFKNLWRFR